MSGPSPEQQRLVGGRYRLLEVVGRGGMGTVWAGEDELLGRAVAVKELLPPSNLSPAELADLRRRSIQEARAAARISSPAAVTVYDVVEEDGHPWIVMELLAPRTLADVLRERTLSPQEAAGLGLDVLAALRAAEAVGVLHRDVKPANLMFRGSDDLSQPVLTDFGIARFVGDPNATVTGTLVGSPAYVAPERASGEPATIASDLWSLGVTLWVAVEGRPLFDRPGALATLTAIVTEEVPEPQQAGALGPVLVGLLRKDPLARTGVEQLQEQLRAVATGETALPPETTRTAVLPVVGPPVVGALAAGASPPESYAGPAGPPTTDTVRVATTQPATRPAPTRPPSTTAPRRGRFAAAALGAVVLLAAVATAFVVFLGQPGDDRDVVGEPVAGSTGNQPAGSEPVSPEVEAPPADPPPTADQEPPVVEEQPAPDAEEVDENPEQDTEQEAVAPAPPAVPEGFRLHQDPTGFSVAVPEEWTTVTGNGTAVSFVDPASGSSLLVDQTATPEDDPVADWVDQERSVSESLTDYELVGQIQGFEQRGWEGADWEFTYAAEGGGRGHKLNRNLITAPGERAYALLWTAADEQWAERRPAFDTVFSSFQPVG